MLCDINLKSSLSNDKAVGTSNGFVLMALSLIENEFSEFVSDIEPLISLIRSDP